MTAYMTAVSFVEDYFIESNRMASVYEWARKRGVFGRKGAVSHLLLDGGVFSIPEDAAAEFLAAYAIGIVRGGTLPCVVEVKTPVFRMFYDLDIHMDLAMADAFVRGEIPPSAETILRLVCETTMTFFESTSRTAVVCASDAPKTVSTSTTIVKLGVHITFDDVFVASPTAIAIRDELLDVLKNVENPFANEWTSIVDVAVFKGSGMRLPWSAKKNEPRCYVPIAMFDGDASVDVWTPIDHRVISASVSAARNLVTRVALRSFRPPTPGILRASSDSDDDVSTLLSSALTHASIQEHAAVLPALDALIPPAYNDGRIIAVLKGDHAVLFRHSSRYCANVDRHHTSSNTYFVLTRRGLRQCCYSRKDDDVGRKYCLCRDFKGDYIEIPRTIADTFLPPPVVSVPPPMPSRTAGIDMDALARASRPKLTIPKPPSKKRATSRTLSVLFGGA